jgi:hypothetical protein
VDGHPNVLRTTVNALHFNPPAAYFDSAQLPDSINSKFRNRKAGTLEIPKDGSSAYIWIKSADGKIHPEKVTVGLTDGSYVEIANNIKEGDEIVIDVDDGSKVQDVVKQQNPFMPQMPTTRRPR